MKANEFFNEMRRTARAWDKTSDFPYTSGAMKALYAWESSIGYGENELEMNDFNWQRDIHDFIETLRKAGIKTFVVTNSGTSLLENLHGYAAEGCIAGEPSRIRCRGLHDDRTLHDYKTRPLER